MINVLIIDDEIEIVELLSIYLKNNNFRVNCAYDSENALLLLKEKKIDIIILDIMLPKMDGFELIKVIRQSYDIPVMFLSAKNEDMDKIYGLGLGADDYMVKPFNPLEVIARLQVLTRRYNKNNKDEQENHNKEQIIEFDNICINQDSCQLLKDNVLIELTSMEYKLLVFMVTNPNRVFTKQQLYEKVWGEEYFGDENIIMVYISKLRDKIEDDTKNPKYIKTIRGLGYRFERKI